MVFGMNVEVESCALGRETSTSSFTILDILSGAGANDGEAIIKH